MSALQRSSDKLKYAAVAGLLPTPTAVESYKAAKGNHQDSLTRRVKRGEFLPTPTATSDPKGGCTRSDPKRQSDTLAYAMHGKHGERGKTSHLNPPFVAEMMGFPVNWTALPFQSGEMKA